MSVIKIKCNDQVMTFENTPVIASGGLEENSVEFSFCAQWDGYARTAVFWRSEKEAYHVILDENDSGIIPSVVTSEPGVIYFGVFGVNADSCRRTTEVLNYRIVKGTITENTKPPEATPEIYDQLLAKYAEVLVALDPAEGMVKEAHESAATAEAAAEAAQALVSSAESAATAAQSAAEAAARAAANEAGAILEDAESAANAAQTAASAAQSAAETAAAEAAKAAPAIHASQHAADGIDPITPELIGAVPENLPLTTDANAQLTAGGLKVTICRYNSSTLNTPYTEGTVSVSSGLIITSANTATYANQIALPNGTSRVFCRAIAGSSITKWREFFRVNDETLNLRDNMAKIRGLSTMLQLSTYKSVDESGAAVSALSRHLQIFNGSSGILGSLILAAYDEAGKRTDYKIYGEHNKPTGTYTGNGSDTGRTVDTGGTGNVLVVWSDDDNSTIIVTPIGALSVTTSDMKFVRGKATFSGGVLTITSTAAYLNTSGSTYNYQCI